MWLDNDGIHGVQELRLFFLTVFVLIGMASAVIIGGFALILLASLISCLLFPASGL